MEARVVRGLPIDPRELTMGHQTLYRLASFEARGLWLELLCLFAMHGKDDYVDLVSEQLTLDNAWTMFQAHSRRRVKRLVAELLRYGLLRADDAGVLRFDQKFIIRPSTRVPIPSETRSFVFERDEYTCVRCSADSDLQIDHIIPVAGGGTNDLSNLQTLCRTCNIKKGAKMPVAANGG